MSYLVGEDRNQSSFIPRSMDERIHNETIDNILITLIRTFCRKKKIWLTYWSNLFWSIESIVTK